MTAARVIVTACNRKWVNHAVQSATGFATSVIACKVEAGVEQQLKKSDTPDGRPGASVLFFAVSGSELEKQLQNRIGQSILTSPTSAAFSGIDKGNPVAMEKQFDTLRRLPNFQEVRRPPLLENTRHGRRVHLRGHHSPDRCSRWRQFPDHCQRMFSPL